MNQNHPPSFYNRPTQRSPGKFQPPQQQKPQRQMSTAKKGCIAIGVFFGILFVISAAIGTVQGIQEGLNNNNATATASALSSLVTPVPTHTPTLVPTQKPTPKPTPKPTTIPTRAPQPTQPSPTPTPCPGINCNPWGYNFTPGNLIYSPPAAFCSYFPCISNFPNQAAFKEPVPIMEENGVPSILIDVRKHLGHL